VGDHPIGDPVRQRIEFVERDTLIFDNKNSPAHIFTSGARKDLGERRDHCIYHGINERPLFCHDSEPLGGNFWPAVAGGGATPGIDPLLPLVSVRFKESMISFAALC
jgi:hypothetical protein